MAEKKSSRILTFDLMRGYFLVAIILDHLNFFPNGLDWWAMRGNLFVTTAEGFFLISGIVLGIVRGAKLVNEPFKNVANLLLKRGVQLYLTTIVLVLIFTLIGWWFYADNPQLKAGIMPLGTDIWHTLGQIITLQYFYGWADYLRLYAIFLFASPLALWLLRRGLWYVLLVANVAVWLLFPVFATTSDVSQDYFQPLAWQLVFFGGLSIGFYWHRIFAWWKARPKNHKTAIRWSVLSLAGITLLGNLVIFAGTRYFNFQAIGIFPDTEYKLYMEFFDKEQLPLARLGLFILWFSAAFLLFRRFESIIVRYLGWLLLPFGTNSLYVYTLHAFFIFFVHLYFTEGNIFFNFIVSVGVILAIRLMIHYRILMKVIPR